MSFNKTKRRLKDGQLARLRDMAPKNFSTLTKQKTFKGYRLVYEVIEKEIIVLVIAVGKRDKGQVYKEAAQRKKSNP